MNSVWKVKVKVALPDIDHKCYYSLKKFKEERMIVGPRSGQGKVCEGHRD